MAGERSSQVVDVSRWAAISTSSLRNWDERVISYITKSAVTGRQVGGRLILCRPARSRMAWLASETSHGPLHAVDDVDKWLAVNQPLPQLDAFQIIVRRITDVSNSLWMPSCSSAECVSALAAATAQYLVLFWLSFALYWCLTGDYRNQERNYQFLKWQINLV